MILEPVRQSDSRLAIATEAKGQVDTKCPNKQSADNVIAESYFQKVSQHYRYSFFCLNLLLSLLIYSFSTA